MEDPAFAMRRAIGRPDAEMAVAATPQQLRRAGQEPNRRWLAHDAMYPIGDPKSVVRGPIFVSENYRGLDAKHQGGPLKPSSTALTFAGAVRVDAEEFHTLRANFRSERSLVNRDFQVWELPGGESTCGKRAP